MKKLLAIVVLGLLWCEVSFALTQQSAINQYLSGRKLDLIEGVWISSSGSITVNYKEGNSYYQKIIQHRFFRNNYLSATLTKGSTDVYYGWIGYFYSWTDGRSEGPYRCDGAVMQATSLNRLTVNCGPVALNQGSTMLRQTYSRLWPENIRSHNAKFEKKKEPKKKKDEFKPSSGTAFFVTQKGHVITNFHVVESCKDKSKIIYQNKEIKVKLLAKDKYLDLALLKADIESKHFIKISNKPPKKLQRIIAAGYPFGKYLSDDMKFTSGIVSSLKGLGDDSTRLQIDAALNPGNSGGPIVDEKTGNLVAVAVSGLNKDLIDNQAVNFGIKAGSVKNFLESNQIDTLTQSKYSFGSVDLSNILEKATVYTFCN